MHELSIAMSIVELAGEEAVARQAAVKAVHLKLGRLSGVVKDALLACYGMASEGTALAGSSLVIQEIPVVGRCPRCDAARRLEQPDWMTCPECRAPITEILEGRELEVFALELAG